MRKDRIETHPHNLCQANAMCETSDSWHSWHARQSDLMPGIGGVWQSCHLSSSACIRRSRPFRLPRHRRLWSDEFGRFP
jgi:hypothetical protein